MRLLILNFTMDPTDPVLGFAPRWAEEICDHFEESVILTGRADPRGGVAVANVINVGWMPGQGPRNVMRLLWQASRHVRRFQPDVAFVHMAATYAAVAGPLFRAWSVPMVLWFEHQSSSPTLRFAEFWSTRIVSASTTYPGRKSTTAIGHGIDVGMFGPRKRTSARAGIELTRAVHAGRADPVKRLDRIVSQLMDERDDSGIPYTFTQIGGPSLRQPVSPDEPSAWSSCDWVELRPSMGRVDLALELTRYDFFVHAYGGAIDKAPLEASLAGLPVLTEGRHVYQALGGDGDPPSLREQLEGLRLASAEELDEYVFRQQQCVLTSHSLAGTAKRLANILKGTARC